MSKSRFHVLLFCFKKNHERRLENLRGFTAGQDEIALSVEAVSRINVELRSRKNPQVVSENRSAIHQDGSDDKLAASFFTGHSQVLALGQRLRQPRRWFQRPDRIEEQLVADL